MTAKRVRSRRRELHPDGFDSPFAELPEVLQFMRLLWEVVHQLQKRSKAMAAELGVTGPQRLVLRIVGLVPGTSAGTLAQILHVHPSTLTGVLHRLVSQKLLRRSAESSDRRRAVLSLTARGEQVNAIGAGTIEASVTAALADIQRRDLTAAERALAIIAEHLENPQLGRSDRRASLKKRRSHPARRR